MSRRHGPLDRIRAARDAARQREAARVAAEESRLHELSDKAFAEAIPAIVQSLGHDATLRLALDRLARRSVARRLWERWVCRCDRLCRELQYELFELGRLGFVAVWWTLDHPLLSAISAFAVFAFLVGVTVL